MASFTGQLIKDTYDSILKAIDNGVIDSTAKNITDGVGNVTPLYISTTQVGIGVTPSTDFHVNGSALIGGSLTITGDLTVNGSTTTISTQTLSVEDPLIILAKDNAANSVDIGFYGKYVDGSTKYAGLFRKAGDNKFHIFSGLGTEPTTTVNTSDASYVISTLVGNLEGNVTGNIIATGAGATQIMSDVRAVTQSANDNSTKIATTAYVDSSAGNYLPLAGGTMSGNIAMGGNNISNVGDITLAATKRLRYADNKIIIGTTNSTLGSEAISIGYDADSTGNQSIGIGYNPQASGTYSVAIGYNVTASGTGTFVFGTSGSHSDNNTFVASGLDLKVTGTGQSSFAGQVTIPATPVADTDAASKGYVDSQITAQDLDFAGGTGTGSVDLDSQTFTIAGTSNEIETSASGQTLTIGLPDDVTVTGELTVSGTGQSSFGGQVTIPATPSASTDAASKGYVDSQVGANNELSEVLANGNTTGGTDISVSSGDDITFADLSKAIFGAGSDLKIFSDGSGGYIRGLTAIQSQDGTDDFLSTAANAGVSLFYNNSKKFETTNTGINVTGGITGDDSVFIEGNTNPNFTAHDITNETYTSLWSGDTEAALTFNHSLFRITNAAYNFTGTDLVTITNSGNTTFVNNVSLVASSAVNLRVTDGTQNIYVGSSGSTRFGLSSGASIIQSTSAAFGIGTQDGQNLTLGTDNTARLTILSGGNIGIGVASPSTKLEVLSSQTNSSIRTGGLEMQSYAVNNSWYAENLYYDGAWKLRSNGHATQMYMEAGVISFKRVASGSAGDSVSPLTTMVLDSSGSVGIGLTSPNKTLSVNGEIFQKTRLNLQRGSSGATTLIQFLNEVGTDRAHIDFGGTNEELSFFAGAGSSEHMRIDSGGDVLIGNTVVNPASGFASQRGFGYDNSTGNLQVASTSGTAMTIGRNESSDGQILQLRKESNIKHSFGSTSSYLLGDVGIGTNFTFSMS